MLAQPSMLKAMFSLVFAIFVSCLCWGSGSCLMSVDVFNRFPNHDNHEHTVHVMKYIFPRQFGLHNVFTSPVDSRETSHTFKDYTLREREIAQSAQRQNMKSGKVSGACGRSLPRRLRGSLVTLVSKLQRLHSRCSYSALLKHYCPVDVRT